MKKVILLFAVFFTLVIIFGFQEQDFSDRQALIEAKVSERVEEYRIGVVRRCREKVMKEANTRVDSILIIRSEGIFIIDSIPRPTRPVKPDKPEVPPLESAEPIAPIIDKN